MRRIFLAGLLLVLLGAAGGKIQPSFDQWKASCNKVMWLDKPTCVAVLAVADQQYLQNGSFFLAFGRYDEFIGLIVASERADLSIVAFKVGDNDPIITRQCEAISCMFEGKSAEILLEQFKTHRRGRIQVAGKVLGFSLDAYFTLANFSESFAEAKRLGQQ